MSLQQPQTHKHAPKRWVPMVGILLRVACASAPLLGVKLKDPGLSFGLQAEGPLARRC